MIKGIGCDIVDLNRLNDRLDEFACKILTSKEFEIYCNKKQINKNVNFLVAVLQVKKLFLKLLE